MTGEPQDRPGRKSGPAHLVAAAGYSLAGLRRLARESAFRHEMLLIGGLLGLFLLAGASLPECLGLLVLGCLLVGIEALNTAVETLVDHLSPGWSAWAKEAKDLGSLAVACLVAATLAYAVAVLVW